MNSEHDLNEQLTELGELLQERPSLKAGIMQQVRRAASEKSPEPVVSPRKPRSAPNRRWPWLSGALIAAGAVVAWMMVSVPQSVGWAEVNQAIRNRPWMRGRVIYPDGTPGTMWVSPLKKVWAFQNNSAVQFFDGVQRVKYEYRKRSQKILKLPLGEADLQQVLPVENLAQDRQVLGPWLFGTEKILDQQRREIQEDGQSWIEFDFVLARGAANQGVLRVDPQTRLPVSLVLKSPADQTVRVRWAFDYPEQGPRDIFDLGVAADVEIDDQVPPEESLQYLDALAASRARIGDFQLGIAADAGLQLTLIRRRGELWRVDQALPDAQRWQADPAPAEFDPLWFQRHWQTRAQNPLYVCNGKTVFENESNLLTGAILQWKRSPRTGPGDLLAGDGSMGLPRARYATFAALFYPDLTPRTGFTFECDSEPAGYAECMLIKRSAMVTWPEGARAHEWYYLDRTKGGMVVRMELFTLPDGQPARPEAAQYRQTIVFEDFQQAPQGWWYARTLHDTTPVLPGAAAARVPARRQPADPSGPQQPEPAPEVPQHKSTVHFYFNFDAPLPEELFQVEETESAGR